PRVLPDREAGQPRSTTPAARLLGVVPAGQDSGRQRRLVPRRRPRPGCLSPGRTRTHPANPRTTCRSCLQANAKGEHILRPALPCSGCHESTDRGSQGTAWKTADASCPERGGDTVTQLNLVPLRLINEESSAKLPPGARRSRRRASAVVTTLLR